MLLEIVVASCVAGGVGYMIGRLEGAAKTSRDLLQTYKHLLEYGRPDKPQATVTQPKPEPEERVLAEIHESAKHRFTDYIVREAGVSKERAANEAERLLSQFETWGAPPA